jgi:hypothetical protein
MASTATDHAGNGIAEANSLKARQKKPVHSQLAQISNANGNGHDYLTTPEAGNGTAPSR